jgi:hypothetical protein
MLADGPPGEPKVVLRVPEFWKVIGRLLLLLL